MTSPFNFLLLGVGNAFWVPISVKYGKRASLLVSTLILFGVLIWTANETTFKGLVAARCLSGFASAAGEVSNPIFKIVNPHVSVEYRTGHCFRHLLPSRACCYDVGVSLVTTPMLPCRTLIGKVHDSRIQCYRIWSTSSILYHRIQLRWLGRLRMGLCCSRRRQHRCDIPPVPRVQLQTTKRVANTTPHIKRRCSQ